MWTAKNRGRYDRSKLRYPSDLTDDEWAHVEPLIPPAKRGGNKRHVEVREVMNGIMYILSTGCQWRAIPKDLPPRKSLGEGWCSRSMVPAQVTRQRHQSRLTVGDRARSAASSWPGTRQVLYSITKLA